MKCSYALVALAACGGEAKQAPPKQEAPVVADAANEQAKRTPEPAPDHGSCTIKVGGAITAEHTTPGGPSKSVTSYWFAPGDTTTKFPEGKLGLILNCSNSAINVNILTKLATKDSVPFGPKKYELKKSGKNELYVIGTIGGKTSVMGATGTIDITAFDAGHIAGTIDLAATTLPDEGDITLVGSFDFKCPGFSGCAK